MNKIAVAWFLESEWDQLRSICPDLQETYAEWLNSAIEGLAPLEADGHSIERVILTASLLKGRERTTGRKVKSTDRAELAIKLMKQGYETRN